eukprot:4883279-Amphidinium_carterae.1
MDVDASREIRMALQQLGGVLVSVWYIALDFQNMVVEDTDPDTVRGMTITNLLDATVKHLDA